MKAMAIVRSSIEWSIDEQQNKINQYAISEGINLVHIVVVASDVDLELATNNLSEVDAVIVTDVTRISRNKETLDMFKEQLRHNDTQLVILS
ncbi:recombinase family protein [Paenibacillus polymyxa]|uniref:Resolvase/invertase-type recombinase catalytic domain-containing protein n=1 Tax=Paenibacillus polymyxa TaxID=1406 RepID=A0A378Y159_PAEPO|nr:MULTISPECIES: recombinase family protein [Paenibacillus]KAF6620495.1 recombinase family protein [Paenibacillus sp. EKM101P]KAF6623487.1 recombinase family protein [Paenibacillus sp. EKM102P]KAF6633950.1 recombinase family protein [Paenibacillus sp. EKM10P]KAF6649477.1 recombinase family protein [Paenibacillus sp. EKM11P]MBE7896190.1 recombinase family protein [Paenibacillus polymyxa]